MVVHYVEREREEWSRLLRKSPGCGYRGVAGGVRECQRGARAAFYVVPPDGQGEGSVEGSLFRETSAAC